jgi:transcription elongation factor
MEVPLGRSVGIAAAFGAVVALGAAVPAGVLAGVFGSSVPAWNSHAKTPIETKPTAKRPSFFITDPPRLNEARTYT